ncbi:CoA-transferase [Pseudorhodoferax soli]|uniref:Glutaconate CoA-transferase subunit B n=1 Tax=Pseudorhodoferax soli TaxID=545864 RepID=A0A368X5C6_9BURK|nr:CoA-transferase [Pseudorhodoferax soli]RCW63200.1 glutaconate CoA-transferase subunit B [Pseudorhodoferax soli]
MTVGNELLIVALARLLRDVKSVATGAASPIPTAAMLLRATETARPVHISALGSNRHNFFTNGTTELFDLAGQGRLDAFFLGGGEIDGHGNVNLVGVGNYPQVDVRWPGSFGSAYMFFVVPQVILFREEHSRRVLVEQVEFISAPGASADNVYRRGGPSALLTSKCLFSFDRAARRFRLDSIHPGVTLEEVLDCTGFAFDAAPVPVVTPMPTEGESRALRASVLPELGEAYPEFARKLGHEIEQSKEACAA